MSVPTKPIGRTLRELIVCIVLRTIGLTSNVDIVLIDKRKLFFALHSLILFHWAQHTLFNHTAFAIIAIWFYSFNTALVVQDLPVR